MEPHARIPEELDHQCLRRQLEIIPLTMEPSPLQAASETSLSGTEVLMRKERWYGQQAYNNAWSKDLLRPKPKFKQAPKIDPNHVFKVKQREH